MKNQKSYNYLKEKDAGQFSMEREKHQCLL